MMASAGVTIPKTVPQVRRYVTPLNVPAGCDPATTTLVTRDFSLEADASAELPCTAFWACSGKANGDAPINAAHRTAIARRTLFTRGIGIERPPKVPSCAVLCQSESQSIYINIYVAQTSVCGG